MPDFTARLTTGVTLVNWDDHATSQPSRLNPRANRPPRYLRAIAGAGTVRLAATMNGVEGPSNAYLAGLGLGGFTSHFAEHPCPYPIGPTMPIAGTSSIWDFAPTVPGHYLWQIRRDGGGAVAIHFDVE